MSNPDRDVTLGEQAKLTAVRRLLWRALWLTLLGVAAAIALTLLIIELELRHWQADAASIVMDPDARAWLSLPVAIAVVLVLVPNLGAVAVTRALVAVARRRQIPFGPGRGAQEVGCGCAIIPTGAVFLVFLALGAVGGSVLGVADPCAGTPPSQSPAYCGAGTGALLSAMSVMFIGLLVYAATGVALTRVGRVLRGCRQWPSGGNSAS